MKTYVLRDKKTGLFSGAIFNSIREAIKFINTAYQFERYNWQILREKEDGSYAQVIFR